MPSRACFRRLAPVAAPSLRGNQTKGQVFILPFNQTIILPGGNTPLKLFFFLQRTGQPPSFSPPNVDSPPDTPSSQVEVAELISQGTHNANAHLDAVEDAAHGRASASRCRSASLHLDAACI